jgi:hypothetical protein
MLHGSLEASQCGVAQPVRQSFIKDRIQYSGRLHADPGPQLTGGATSRATRVPE